MEKGVMAKCPQLDGENYRDWASRVRDTLKYKKLWKCVIADKVEDQELDDQAFAVISLMCNNIIKDDIADCGTAREAWVLLEKKYVRGTPAAKVALYCELTSLKCNQIGETKEMLDKFSVVVKRIKEQKVVMDDDMYTIILLKALPPNFEQFRVALLTRDALPDLPEVMMKVEEEYRRQTQYSESTTSVVPAAESALAMFGNRGCFGCGQQGHIRRFCPHNNNRARATDHHNGNPGRGYNNGYQNSRNDENSQRNHRDGHQQKQSGQYSMFASVMTTFQLGQVILDSGSSSHIFRDRQLFVEMRSHREEIRLADGSVIICRSIGTVNLIVDNNNEVIINNCLYIPECQTNLLSISRCADAGWVVEFDSSGAKLYKFNQLLASANMCNGHYYLNHKNINSVHNINSESRALTMREWHRRLGHVNIQAIEKMSRGLVDGLSVVDKVNKLDCKVCAECKITVNSFPKTTMNRSCELLGRVHSDVCEMPKLSYGGKKYFITFIDDYSRFVAVYPLETKGEAVEAWLKYKAKVERQTGKKIKVLRSDNGKEYVNNRMREDLERCGIAHETSVPHSPAQNGVAERMNRVLVEMVRCMLADGEMPPAAWAEALLTAAYVRNRCASSVVDTTPFEMMHGRKPKLGHMQRFGACVVALKKGQQIDKLSPRGYELRFCGYAPTQKGYRLLNINTGGVIVSRDCRFIERRELDDSSEEEDCHDPRNANKYEEEFEDAECDEAGPSGVTRKNPGRMAKNVKSYREEDSDEEF